MKNMKLKAVTIVKMLSILIVALIGFSFASCKEAAPGASGDPQTVTYTGISDGQTYTLKITENTARYTAQSGDAYELTAESKKSTGKVDKVENDVLTLKPSNAANTFKVTVSENGITGFTGSVTWNGESTPTSLPETLTGGGTPGGGETVPDEPIITTITLPHGEEGKPYNQTLTATGKTPITWSKEDTYSSLLPFLDGLSFSANGVISGTPTKSGTSAITVTATNEYGSATKQLTIVIDPPTFTTISDFRSWLNRKPANAKNDAYKCKLNLSALSDSTFSILEALNDYSTKFVSLDFSGSTFTSIQYNDFFEIDNSLDNLIEIILPNSVTRIYSDAFRDCTNLRVITFPNNPNFTSIESGTFSGCALVYTTEQWNSEGFVIPSSVTSIGDYAFAGCKFLNLTIPNSVISIGNYAFSDCTELGGARQLITIPSSVTSIGNYAFSGCKNNLWYVTFATGSNISSFGNNAFPEGYNGTDVGNTLRTAYSTGKAGTYSRSRTSPYWTKQ